MPFGTCSVAFGYLGVLSASQLKRKRTEDPNVTYSKFIFPLLPFPLPRTPPGGPIVAKSVHFLVVWIPESTISISSDLCNSI